MNEETGQVGDGTAGAAIAASRNTMGGKPVLWRQAKTVLTRDSKSFQEKLLCDGLSLNMGDLCVYSCSFCYVESQVHKLIYKQLREYNAQTGEDRGGSEVVVRREKAVEILRGQIRAKDDDVEDRRVVYGSTLVDVAANMDLLRETAELVTWILDKTHWQVRLLSKSNLLHRLVQDHLVPGECKLVSVKWSSTEVADPLGDSGSMGAS